MKRSEYYFLGFLIIALGSFSCIISAYSGMTLTGVPILWQTIPLSGMGGFIMVVLGIDFLANLPPKSKQPINNEATE